MSLFPCSPSRQSFAVLRGAVLGLQDGGDDGDASRPSPEPAEEPPGEGQPHGDQTDNGHGPASPGKQEQSQHVHLMVELLRPQDDIRLVRPCPEPSGHLKGDSHSSGGKGEWSRARVYLESSDVRAGGTLGSVEVTQTTTTLLFQLELFEQAEVVSSGLWRELVKDGEVCPT